MPLSCMQMAKWAIPISLLLAAATILVPDESVASLQRRKQRVAEQAAAGSAVGKGSGDNLQ